MPLFPLATCIQVTNAVWESSVKLFILHSKAYNKERGFYLLNRNYHDCLLLLRYNKMWPDYLEPSILLQNKCHETTLVPAPTVRYVCHSVWNKGTVPVSIQVTLLIFLKTLENLIWLVNEILFIQIRHTEIEEQELFLYRSLLRSAFPKLSVRQGYLTQYK